MKNPWEWDESNLLDMVKAGTQESIELDFKESKALVNVKGQKDVRYEISKDISALANSAGGTLIYGMVENGHVATGLDTGSDPNVVTKEWLQQVITSTIHQKIDGVRIKQIELTTKSPGKVAYVVNIPQSMRTPHQALDKKFYKRYEFESVPMEEYEVRDLYRRGETPDLRIEFSLLNGKLGTIQGTTEYEPISLLAIITNDAIEPANYAVIKLFIDNELSIISAGELEKREGLFLSVADIHHPVTLLSMNWGIPGKLPIFNDARFTFPNSPIMLKVGNNEALKKKTYLLGYEVKSPRMNMKQAFTVLARTDDMISISEQYLNAEELRANYHKLRIESTRESHI